MTKNNKYFGIITLLKLVAIIGGLYLFYYINVVLNPDVPAYIHNYKICMEVYNNEFKGVIIKNWSSTRGGYFTKLSNGTFFGWRCSDNVTKLIKYQDSIEIWELLEVGDSLYKPAGTFNTYIYKQANPDSVIFIECNYDCEINLRGKVEAPELKINSVTRYKNNMVLKKLTLNWKFDKKLEKYIKGFVVVKENPDKSIDTSKLLSTDTRFFYDSLFPVPKKLDVFNEKYVYFKYKLIVVIEGIKDEKSFEEIIPYINWKKVEEPKSLTKP